MSNYQQTVPAQMCLFWYDSCIAATGTDAEAQFNCIQTRDARCGNDTVEGTVSDSTSSASPSGTNSPSGTSGSGSEASPTSSDSSAPANSQAAAASFATYGTPALAGGLLALFGLAL